jgi:hypothetical protein
LENPLRYERKGWSERHNHRGVREKSLLQIKLKKRRKQHSLTILLLKSKRYNTFIREKQIIYFERISHRYTSRGCVCIRRSCCACGHVGGVSHVYNGLQTVYSYLVHSCQRPQHLYCTVLNILCVSNSAYPFSLDIFDLTLVSC